MYYHGYWINKKWFEKYKEDFLEEFKFPVINDKKNKWYQDEILNNHSVCLHIRRGDYVEIGQALKPEECRQQIKAFVNALKECSNLEYNPQKWNLMLFSDNIEWCKQNREAIGIDIFGKVIFIEGNNVDGKNFIDLQLMSMCEGVILSNSAFSYLATLLNTRKRIVSNLTMREF